MLIVKLIKHPNKLLPSRAQILTNEEGGGEEEGFFHVEMYSNREQKQGVVFFADALKKGFFFFTPYT